MAPYADLFLYINVHYTVKPLCISSNKDVVNLFQEIA